MNPLFASAFALLVMTNSASAQTVDITKIYENYIAASVAAGKCSEKDKATEGKFAENLMFVTINAMQKVKERTKLSDDKVGMMFKTNTDSLTAQVGKFVDANGCDSETVRNLLKMHKMHSTMNLFEAGAKK